VLEEIGYDAQTAAQRLPRVDEITFTRGEFGGREVGGGVFNEGGGMKISVAADIDPTDWRRVGPIMVHELGHFPARRVYTKGRQVGHRLVVFGFDRKQQVVTELGERHETPEDDDPFMIGVFREPIADLFGYYCTGKRGNDAPYQADKYYRETAFMAAMLQQLAEIRGTNVFAEFARVYKSFNERDYAYFLTLRQDMAKFYGQRDFMGVEEAQKRAADFVMKLNNITTEGGNDRVLARREGSVYVHTEGSQLTKVAKTGGFYDKYEKNIKAICGDGLILDGATIKMKKYIS